MDQAKKVVAEILTDLKDRRGLRQAWESIDADIQEEIVTQWESLVRGVLALGEPKAWSDP